MRMLIVTLALLALVGAPVAIAQPLGSQRNVPESTDPNKNLIGGAPTGHRQPRAKDLPSDITEPNDPQAAAAEKALDRKIKSICRGC